MLRNYKCVRVSLFQFDSRELSRLIKNWNHHHTSQIQMD